MSEQFVKKSPNITRKGGITPLLPLSLPLSLSLSLPLPLTLALPLQL